MQIGPDGINYGKENLYIEGDLRIRKRFLLALLALFVLGFIYLMLRTTQFGLLSPFQTVANIYTAARLKAAQLFHLPLYNDRMEIIEAHDAYLETVSRLETLFIAAVLGAVMSAAGAVFQCVFRNPIAMPTMLGVSSGINIANLILVFKYSLLAPSMLFARFEYSYAVCAALLLFIILTARLSSRGKGFVVADLLLIGATVTRLITQIITNVAYNYMEDTDYTIYQEMNNYGTGLGNVQAWIFLAGTVMIGLIPLLFMRNSLNLATFSDEEARIMGLNTTLLRIFALIFSTVLIITAQIYCGDIGMLALMVPHVCRYLFGSDMRVLLTGSIVMGAIIMVICRFAVAFTYFSDYLAFVSVSMIVNLVCFPLTLFIMITDRRGWE